MGQIFVVADPVGQVDVESALLFPEREVAAAVDGAGEHIRIVMEDFRRAVSLVNIEVEDGGPANGGRISLGSAAQGFDGHGDVVEDTESGAFVEPGVLSDDAVG